MTWPRSRPSRRTARRCRDSRGPTERWASREKRWTTTAGSKQARRMTRASGWTGRFFFRIRASPTRPGVRSFATWRRSPRTSARACSWPTFTPRKDRRSRLRRPFGRSWIRTPRPRTRATGLPSCTASSENRRRPSRPWRASSTGSSRSSNPGDMDALSHAMEEYEQTIAEHEKDFRNEREKTIRRLRELTVDRGKPEKAKTEEDSLMMEDLEPLEEESVPIINVGGIEPVFAGARRGRRAEAGGGRGTRPGRADSDRGRTAAEPRQSAQGPGAVRGKPGAGDFPASTSDVASRRSPRRGSRWRVGGPGCLRSFRRVRSRRCRRRRFGIGISSRRSRRRAVATASGRRSGPAVRTAFPVAAGRERPGQVVEGIRRNPAENGGQAFRRNLRVVAKNRGAETASPGCAHHDEPAAARPAGAAGTTGRHQLPAAADAVPAAAASSARRHLVSAAPALGRRLPEVCHGRPG